MSDSKKRISAPVKLIFAVLAVAILAIIGFFLIVNKGTVDISATPPDATIYIDEKLSTTVTKLAPGQHTIKVAKEGYAAFFRSIKISSGTTKKISPFLKQLPVPQEIASNANFVTQYGSIVYYTSNNTLFKKNGDVTQQITPNVLDNVSKILLLPDEQQALILKNSSLYFYEFKRYDLINQTSTLIAENVGDFALSNDGTKIAYSNFPPTGEKLIMLADNNGQDKLIAFNLKTIDSNKPKLSFNSSDTTLFIADKDFYLLSLITSDINKITDGVSNILPSPSSPMILTSDTSNSLKVTDYQGKVLYALKSQTPISKTSWIKDSNDLVFAIDNVLYKVSLTDLKMTPYQTAALGNITSIVAVDGHRVLYLADNKLFQVDTITGWE